MSDAQKNKKALLQAYQLLSPYSDGARWEFNSNLVHLDFITKYIQKGSEIFDGGCGIGILALALQLLGYQVAGGDKYVFETNNNFLVNKLNQLKQIWQNNDLKINPRDIIKDAWSQKYDAVISVATIEHQRDPKRFLEKLKEGVKRDGYLYLATPNPTHLLNRFRFLLSRSAFSSLENFFQQGENFVGHWREYTLAELKLMFKWLNIEIVEAKNLQDKKPYFLRIRSFREFYIACFRLLSYFIPGAGEANLIIGRKIEK